MGKLDNTKNQGFTLIEMLIVLLLLAFLAGLTIPFYNKFQNTNNLELASSQTIQTLRRAQGLAQANWGEANWGVYIEQGELLLFQGNSHSTRNIDFDEKFDLAENIIVSGLQEIIFEQLSGETSNTGTINFASNNENKTITINHKGMLQY